MKKITSFRMTPRAKELLEQLAAHLGVSQTAVIELAIRELARKEGLS